MLSIIAIIIKLLGVCVYVQSRICNMTTVVDELCLKFARIIMLAKIIFAHANKRTD